MNNIKRLVVLILLLSTTIFILALEDGGKNRFQSDISIKSILSAFSINVALIFSLVILILVIISIHYEKKLKKYKKWLFLGIIIPVIITTLYLVASTVYLNLISETKGPVHWHADFEIWNCGKKINLIDPKGLSNRIGTSVLHEHNDDRIHVEGVVVNYTKVDLSSFFEVIFSGGQLTKNELVVPTNDGVFALIDGDECNGRAGKLQVFLYRIINPEEKKSGFIYKQEKLENFENYVLSPYSTVPPGDCIIIEFGEEKEKTEHICETYKTATEKGDLVGS